MGLGSIYKFLTNFRPREKFCWSFFSIFLHIIQLACSSEQSHKWIKKIYINFYKCFQAILKKKNKKKTYKQPKPNQDAQQRQTLPREICFDKMMYLDEKEQHK